MGPRLFLAFLSLCICFVFYSGFTRANSTSVPTTHTTSKYWNLTTTATTKNKPANCSDNEVLVDLKCIDKDLKKNNSSLVQLLFVTAVSGLWVIYITYFNSRLVGFILTRVLNQFYKDGYIKVGSLSFSVLSGKVMFRDVQYITPDLSLKIYDGYLIFRWWRPYKFGPWRKKRDLSQGHTRLSIVISGLEYHIYNRCREYERLEKLFGLDSKVFSTKSNSESKPRKNSDKEHSKIAWWRNLIPVIKFTISYGKVIFGNKLLPSTLVAAFDDASFQYKTTKASNQYDLFMHALEGSLGSLRFMLVDSPKYDQTLLPPHRQGPLSDSPPRKMSEGFDLAVSNNVNFKYTWDEPGIYGKSVEQSKHSEIRHHENETEDAQAVDESPVWEMEVRCEKRATVNYGPWADRQIMLLWRFFYPIDYQNLTVTPECKEGDVREAKSFTMYLNLLHESDIDLWFLKNEETNAIHINLAKGSCIEMNVPMVVEESGFCTHVSGRCLFPQATSSMLYRPLLDAETLSFNISANYPLCWNDHQLWTCDFKATKASASLVFAHKNFISDLMDDWSSKDLPDLFTFAPYLMKLNFDLQDFELLLPANEHNWVDCATKRKENALVGLCGESLKIDLLLPFNSFIAPTYTVPVNFLISKAELCLFLPQSNPSRDMLLNLSESLDSWNTGKISEAENEGNKNGNNSAHDDTDPLYDSEGPTHATHRIRKDPKWGMIDTEWVKCWDAPSMELTISYTWHPILPTREDNKIESSISKESEKSVQRQSSKSSKSHKRTGSATDSIGVDDVTPLLQGASDKVASHSKTKTTSVKFDPTALDPDEIRVDLNLKPGSTLYLYGSLLHHFIAIKENYLGVDDICTDFADGQQEVNHEEKGSSEHSNDPLYYRTLQVTVNVHLHNIRGVLPIHPNPVFRYCPTVELKRLSFEMDKNYNQTRLQLLLSKLIISTEENGAAMVTDKKGWLALLDLQLRGHAMFSGAGLPLGAVTIEYGWLTEVLVGPVVGNLSIPQIQCITQWAQSFIFLFKNNAHEMKPAFPKRYLPTGINWDYTKQDGTPVSEDDVKFLMAQVKLESVTIRIEESNSVLDVSIAPILVSNGNIQFPGVKEAAAIRVQEFVVKHRIKKMDLIPSNGSLVTEKSLHKWVEAGEVRFGSLHATITVATAERLMHNRQTKFLHFHDKKTRRLHFLWQECTVDSSDPLQNAVLAGVQSLKSWGCSFFTPLTSKHPTYFYYKNKASGRYKMNSTCDGGMFRKPRGFPALDEELSTSSSEESESDRNSDVFDPCMDYGMSLLTEGKCLLSRSRTVSNMSKKSETQKSPTPVTKEPSLEVKVPAGEIVNAPEVDGKTPNASKSRPSLRRQSKITGSSGNIVGIVPSKASKQPSPSAARASAMKKQPLVDSGSNVKESVEQSQQQQVSFAPSPEKLSAARKSSSQTNLDVMNDIERQSMKRAMSSDSNLYRSAESDFKSTTSLSSGADDFYSAESDMAESKRNSVASDLASYPTASAAPIHPTVTGSQDPLIPPRPETLVLENERAGTTQSPVVDQKSPLQANSVSLSPMSANSVEDPSQVTWQKSFSPPKKPQREQQSLLTCYESYLALLRLETPEDKEKSRKMKDEDEESVDGAEDIDLLPQFVLVRDGIHPSVMVDKGSMDLIERQHKKTDLPGHDLSFEDVDSSGKATSISVHLKESLDVQVTPFLLDTLSSVLDATIPVITNENPLSVIANLEVECAEDAAARMPEKDKSKTETSADNVVKSPAKLQKQSKVNADTIPDTAKKITPIVTRPPPGTKLSVRLDKVRINVLQATLGDDRIFSLRSNKLLPAPCVTVLATRLDSMHISVDLNSRRKNRLLLENYRKLSRSSSGGSEKKPTNPKYSTSSELATQKHFLVLLNAKANARSVACQMRALTCDGSVPEMTSITALMDKSCKAPFDFDPSVIMPDVKNTLDKWKSDHQGTDSTPGHRKSSRSHPPAPPRLWGWVMLEAGVDNVKVNVIKQVPVKGAGISASRTNVSMEYLDRTAEFKEISEIPTAHPLEESVHVHFLEKSQKSLSDDFSGQTKNGTWSLQDTGLHASQGELFIDSVWINVPSPSLESTISTSRALRTWNLLSCVSASVNCWLDPIDRTQTTMARFQDERLTRHCAVAACVLTEAFENLKSGEEAPEKCMEPTKHKYDVLTDRAKYLRKDPNYLLCHELQRFLRNETARETTIVAVGPATTDKQSVPRLPALSTLKKGVAALIRQWTSQYAGAISWGQLPSRRKESSKVENATGLYAREVQIDGAQNMLQTEPSTSHRASLVVEVDIPGESATVTTPLPARETVPRRKSNPTVIKKSDTVTSLSAIEEGMSLVSGMDVDASAQEQQNRTGKQRTPTKTRQSHMTSTEELVYEQQQSMYSWMSNAVKYNSPTQGEQTGQRVVNDVESQVDDNADVFSSEEVDFPSPSRLLQGVRGKNEPGSPANKNQPSSTMQITDYEEVFEIFLRNIGIHSESANSSKTNSSADFIVKECLGSLSVNANLHSLSVEKQEADPLYSQDLHSRRKRKSVKSRKQRSYYSSLEHARDPRNSESISSSTWPNVSVHVLPPVHTTPPILMCQDIMLKSSTIASKVENLNASKSPDQSKLEETIQVMKNKSTLKVGMEMSCGSIVQHVDIALIRLIHQISQISDNIKQAKTDIQVNKYTEGSVSPDIKVIHRRTDSNASSSSADVGPAVRRMSSMGEFGSNASLNSNEIRDSDAGSTSTESTEVPHCWQEMYKMVDLYSTIPDQKTETITKPVSIPTDAVHLESEGFQAPSESNSSGSVLRRETFSVGRHDPYLSLVLKAKASVKKIRMLAAIGDMRLEGEISDLLSHVDHTKTAVHVYRTKASSDFGATLDGIHIKLVDKACVPRPKTIAETSVEHSSLTASTNHDRNSQDNVCSLQLGLISLDLSQHPASLHDVVSRGSRQLSVHISEFANTPTVKQSQGFDSVDGHTPYIPATPGPSSTTIPPMTPMTPSALTMLIDLSQDSSSAVTSTPVTASFNLKSDGIVVMATLLPSLRAQYKTGEISGEGRTGMDATFSVSMPSHMLQFTTVNSSHDFQEQHPPTIIDLPQINVEGEYKQGKEEGFTTWGDEQFTQHSESGSSNLQLRSGDYLSVSVNIGSFEHCLTTDLLNQLVFLQEVFMKEINEMVDKVSKSSKPVPLWSETSLRSEESSNLDKPLLYQLKLTLQGIQITASTLSCNAVRLKTGEMMFELSNRVVQNKRTKKKKKGLSVPKYLKLFGKAQVDLTLSLGTLVRNSVYPEAEDEFQQFAYFTTRIGLQNTRQGKDSFGLGGPTAQTGNMSAEASSTFPEGDASTSTSVPLQNPAAERLRLPGEPQPAASTDNSVVLISLKRPIFFIQPTAFDKAILIYLSYKNAYEDWKDQQENVMKMARQVRDVLHPPWSQPASATSLPRVAPQHTSTIFLQLSVNDLGICLPVTQNIQFHEVTAQDELSSALVLTIDSTLISAYYSRSLVTKGYLKGFCLRFADDFQTSWDDWKQNIATGSSGVLSGGSAPVMNACVVPEGTYEICSDTTTYNTNVGGPPVAKTTVNVLWKMMAVDVHMDTKIGSYFSRLADTLMVITGQDEPNYEDNLDIHTTSKSEGEDPVKSDTSDIGPSVHDGRRSRSATVASTVSSASSLRVQKERTRKIEHELNEQVKVVNDLRQLGAKKSVIEEEERRMHELEAALSSNFRRVVRSRLRRSSINTGSKKGQSATKFRPTHHRAKSATLSTTEIDIAPRASKSAHSTLPRQLRDGNWMTTMRGTYSSSDARGFRENAPSDFEASPSRITPMNYDSDHVFPPTPDKSQTSVKSSSSKMAYHLREEDSSSSDNEQIDEVDFSKHNTRSSLRPPSVRRALYSDHSDSADVGHTEPRLMTSKSESHLPTASVSMGPGPEAELQLELDVRVEMDGGKIECHPHIEEMEISVRPDFGMIPPTYSNAKSRNLVKNTTVFYIPVVDVKVHYNSARSDTILTVPEANRSKPAKEAKPTMDESGAKQRKTPMLGSFRDKTGRPQKIEEDEVLVPEIELTTPSHFAEKEAKRFVIPEVSEKAALTASGQKRACVYAWLSLQSLPEMVISPYLLDFLEQTLAELPTDGTPSHSFSQKHSTTSSQPGSLYDSFDDDDGSDGPESEKNDIQDGSLLSSETSFVSLPLDVVVSVNVQPSQVRFNCVPMSRVECLFQIPSMDLAFSSVQDESFSPFESSKNKPSDAKLEEQKSTDSSQFSNASLKTPSGLSFSAILSDFSIYVFHPYGGKQPAGSTFPLDPMGSFTTSPMPGTDSPFQKSGSGRRDSLSVNLEFVKINLVRRKKGETILLADISSPGGAKAKIDDVAIHLSGLMDIGTASFKYDMRRLNEILAFPRAWYRRSIARRLFLGDTSEQLTSSPKMKPKGPKPPHSSTKLPQTRSRAHTNPVDSSILSFLTVDSPLRNSNLHRHEFSQSTTSTRSPTGHIDNKDEVDSSPGGTGGPVQWHAVVLLGLNMSRLDVEMNMSNVMGNTVWSCDALHSQGRLMFHSNGDRDIILSCGLDNSQLNARGGIIGGQVELKKFDADCHLLDPADGDPLHKLGMRAGSLDGRIEYMGGCVMIGQLTNVDLKLKDEWRDPKQSIPVNMDKSSVFVHCDLGWRVFQLAISRSTTPDVIKMLSKLEEFFSQQLHSSVRAISTWTQSHPRPVSPKKFRESVSSQSGGQEAAKVYDHRRHWPPVFKAIAETLSLTQPTDNSVQQRDKSFLLGGSACLHGEGLIVVCFHGANFRSRSWVLFNILQPNIVFSTEVQEIKESISGDETSTLAIQSLTVNLGHDLWLSRTLKPTDPMATVSRVTRSRNQNPPPGSAPISEWFAYMTASHNEELKMLRTLNDIGAMGGGGPGSASSAKVLSPNSRSASSGSLVAYGHEADIIFALPKVQLDFKTEHMQGPTEPDPEDKDNKPVVECSFVTEFTDHICVTMDVELILFLHDLVSSYLKEKQQALSSRSKHSSLNVSHWNSLDGSFNTEQVSSTAPIDPIDLRTFVCNTWQLEPTVRLISWAGRRIEPVGVDYILQKLGFQHARTTIPKWFQRGILDLLDKGLAAIVQKLVVAIINQKQHSEENQDD